MGSFRAVALLALAFVAYEADAGRLKKQSVVQPTLSYFLQGEPEKKEETKAPAKKEEKKEEA
eukprot:CAMPEP_0197652062 /NCGR_PEP_ID=MMETSP1338-20131121/34222_1 /TAXON_ID=43686 ORGANISM="Pelagodinium beii, Strain RCC1491" /NCGR_SAMPLE_ID=MMETSP1338 /ASSEMBLY_ACC=CAM_ASM_000754 /LENGTH=61 /DNA_ID=CAMNT_0043226857 /DNA_START=60 /DNA_END=242 /DNA_ORIENTATION=-